MISVRVCSLYSIGRYETFSPQYLVSVIDKGFEASTCRPPWIPEENHFAFYFADTTFAGEFGAPTPDDIEALVALGRRLCAPGSDASILIHCAAGVSRSPAAAYIFHCIHLGPGQEKKALHHAAAGCESTFVFPNALVVGYADEIMKRGGKMVRALEEWEGEQLG